MSTTLNNIQVNGTSYNIRNIYYGELTSTASTAAKVATTSTSDNFSLAAGNTIVLSCGTGHGNTVEEAITLNVDSTGAKSVYYHGAATSTTNPFTWSEDSVLTFVYDGANFIFIAMDKGGSGGSTGSGIIVQDENGNLVVSDIEGGVAYTEGAGIDIVNGVISAEVTPEDIPTKTSDLTNDSGFVTTDTKNTAGATNSTSALYLVGAGEQTANPQTYTNSNVSMQDGYLIAMNGVATQSLSIETDSELQTQYGFDAASGSDSYAYLRVEGGASGSYRSTIMGMDSDAIVLQTQQGRSQSGIASHIVIDSANQTTEIHGLVTPTLNDDAATKGYVDNSIPTVTSDLTNDSNFVVDASYVHTDNNYTSTEKSKLSGIAAGAEVNVQANWTETSSTSDAYIQNKPNLATVATTGDYSDLLNAPGDKVYCAEFGEVPADDIYAVLAGDYPGLFDGAFFIKTDTDMYRVTSALYTNTANGQYIITASGSGEAYSFEINGVSWSTISAEAVSEVGWSGNYSDLTNKPTIPTKTSDLTNDSNFITTASIPIATTAAAGIVQPDNETITIDNGIISAIGGGGSSSGVVSRADYMELVLSTNTTAGTTAAWQWKDIPLDTLRSYHGTAISKSTDGYHVVINEDGYYRINGWVSMNAQGYAATVVKYPNNTTEQLTVEITNSSSFNGASVGSTIRYLQSGSLVGLQVERSGTTDPTIGGGGNLTGLVVQKITRDTESQDANLAKLNIQYLDVVTATTTNSNVSPFGAYVELTPNLPSGVTVIGCRLKGVASTNPGQAIYREWDGKLFVYTKSAQSDYEVRISYIDWTSGDSGNVFQESDGALTLSDFGKPAGKLLFEGTWAINETKTVTGANDYCLFAVKPTGSATYQLAFSLPTDGNVRTFGGYVNTTPNMFAYSTNFTRSGESWTLIEARDINIAGTSLSTHTIEQIFGIM